MLCKEVVEKISEEVYQRFPDFLEVKPKVKKQRTGDGVEGKPPGCILIYRHEVAGAGGQAIVRVVRVVANEDGKIKKIAESK